MKLLRKHLANKLGFNIFMSVTCVGITFGLTFGEFYEFIELAFQGGGCQDRSCCIIYHAVFIMPLIYQALRVALRRCKLPVKQLQNPLHPHCIIPRLQHLGTSNDPTSSSSERNQPVSFLQSKAATYRINEIDPKDWKRKQRVYRYIILPLSVTFLVYLVYAMYFAKPDEDKLTEEQLLHLLEVFEESEENKASKEQVGKPTTNT